MNPFYYPEDFEPQLRLEASLELSGQSYSFDLVAVWTVADDPTGRVYTATDSGCSCPTPFEDFESLAALTPVGRTRITRAPREGDWAYDEGDWAKAVAGEDPWKRNLENYMVVTQESFESLRKLVDGRLTDQDRFYGSPDLTEAEDFKLVLDRLERGAAA
jgi:hypothetical protein